MISPDWKPPSEVEALEWLIEQSETHEAGMRRTGDLWPEVFWELADRVATEGRVSTIDASELRDLYAQWQRNEEDEDDGEDSVLWLLQDLWKAIRGEYHTNVPPSYDKAIEALLEDITENEYQGDEDRELLLRLFARFRS